MSGFVGLSTPGVPRGSVIITQVVWGTWTASFSLTPKGASRPQRSIPIGHFVAHLSTT